MAHPSSVSMKEIALRACVVGGVGDTMLHEFPPSVVRSNPEDEIIQPLAESTNCTLVSRRMLSAIVRSIHVVPPLVVRTTLPVSGKFCAYPDVVFFEIDCVALPR